MSPFDHVSILFSILMGLALARLLGGAGRCILDPERSLHWLPGIWTVNLLVFEVVLWWLVFQRVDLPTWSFAHYAVTVTYPLVLYSLAVLLYPQIDGGEGTAEAFLGRRGWFFGIWIGLMALDNLETRLAGEAVGWSAAIVLAAGSALMVSVIVVRNRVYQGIVAGLFLALTLEAVIRLLPVIR